MAQFTNFFPESAQTDVTRTTVIRFTITDDSYGVIMNSLGVTINDGYAISSGAFVNGYRGNFYPSIGKYVIGIYPKSPSFLPYASDVKINISVNDAYGGWATTVYHFYTDGYNPIPPEPIPPHPDGSRACLKDRPEFFPTEVGADWANNTGIGTQLELTWKQAAPYDTTDVVYYNIYYSSDRGSVYNNPPEFVVNSFEATVGGFTPGDSLYIGVRAAEFDPALVTINGLVQAGPDMYFYPVATLTSDINSAVLVIPVDSVDGFPDHGILHIGTELIRYSSIQTSPNRFIITTSGRGIYATTEEAHSSGDEVRIFKGNEDGNSKVITVTPSFQKPNYALAWQRGDGYGDDGYRDGFDGYGVEDGYYRYRQTKYDSITTDGYANDESGDFHRIDFCSWRSMSPSNFMKGQCVGSYFGGVQARFDSQGNKYLVKETNVQTHLLQREEMLLETTGEPFILVRRMWTGVRCMCIMMRQEHPDARCPICFNTGYVSGYNQIFNPRRVDRKILVRVDPSADDLNIVDRGGLEPQYEPTCWTITFPMIKDRDVLVRFNPDNTEEFRYEILSVDRMRSFFGQTAAQKFKIKRIPKTDIIYQFPITRTYHSNPNIISTSVSFSPGMPEHYHNVVVADDLIDYSRLKVATLESQGHNHIIINGIVYGILGHTHILPFI